MRMRAKNLFHDRVSSDVGTDDPGGIFPKSEAPDKTTGVRGSGWWRRNAGRRERELVVEGKVDIFIIRQHAGFHSLAPRIGDPQGIHQALPLCFFFLLETSSSSALLHHLSNLNRPLKPAHNGYMLIKHFLLTQLLARKRKKRKRAMGLAVWLKTLRQTP